MNFAYIFLKKSINKCFTKWQAYLFANKCLQKCAFFLKSDNFYFRYPNLNPLPLFQGSFFLHLGSVYEGAICAALVFYEEVFVFKKNFAMPCGNEFVWQI